MSVTMGSCGDMSPKEYPLRISLMRISSGQQMPLTAYRGRIWGTVLRKNSLKHSLTLFAQPERLRQPQFWLNLTLQPKLWLRWNSFFYRWVSNLNLQFTGYLFISVQYRNSYFSKYKSRDDAIPYQDGWLIRRGKSKKCSFYAMLSAEYIMSLCQLAGFREFEVKKKDGSCFIIAWKKQHCMD